LASFKIEDVQMLNRSISRAFLCALFTACGVASVFAQTPFGQIAQDMRAFATAVGSAPVAETPRFGQGPHSALMDRALSADRFRELNRAARLPHPTNQPAEQILEAYMDVLKLLTKRYERLFEEQPQRYGQEHLRIVELQVIRLIAANAPEAPSGPPAKPLTAENQKLSDSLGELLAKLKPVLQQQTSLELKDWLTDSQVAEIKKLADLS
jgi:hypothetical protein